MKEGEARKQRERWRSCECIGFAEGKNKNKKEQKNSETLNSLIYVHYWKNVIWESGIFPSEGRSLWGGGGCQMLSCAWYKALAGTTAQKECTYALIWQRRRHLLLVGIGSLMALVIWINALHFWWCNWSVGQKKNSMALHKTEKQTNNNNKTVLA